jgi:predicted DNA-binding transcriptional regulator AlpA
MQKSPDSSRLSLLNQHQVAKALGVSVATIRQWRRHSKGPTFIRVGVAIRYSEQDFIAWLKSRPSGGERIAEAARD